MEAFRKKSVEQSLADVQHGEHKLARVLGPLQLIVIGVGVTVGTGIFVLSGVAAATRAGPAIVVSFLLAGVACSLAAFCYAEFASTVPVSGSAYTYAYATLGELPAWIIGWDLILEYGVAAAAVAIGWSQYFRQITEPVGASLPAAISGGPSSIVNAPAMMIVVVLTIVAMIGIELSARVTLFVTTVKLAVVVVFIGVGARFVNPANWVPFVPPAAPLPGVSGGSEALLGTTLAQLVAGAGSATTSFGLPGIVAGAAIIFFAYLGFDVVATTAEETRNPQRDMPLGILGSLGIATVLYVLVSLVMTGMVPYTRLNSAAPMATALGAVGQQWAAGLISIGAIAGLTTVIIVLLVGQSRIVFAMSRDALLPPVLAAVHPRFQTPYRITLLTGALVAIIAGVTPIGEVAELVNIGTLLAFAIVAGAVLVYRKTRPELHRGFRTPLVPFVPLGAIATCAYLMANLPLITWLRLFVWLILGLSLYLTYGRHHSRLAQRTGTREITQPSWEASPSRHG